MSETPQEKEDRLAYALAAVITVCMDVCEDPTEAITVLQAALGATITDNALNGLPDALEIAKLVNESLLRSIQKRFLAHAELGKAPLQ